MGNSATQNTRSDSSEEETPDLSNLRPFLNLPPTASQPKQPANMNQVSDSSALTKVDAAITRNSLRVKPITTDQKQIICEELDKYEKISLVYLVANGYKEALETMIKLNRNDHVFHQFLTEQIKSSASSRKIIEALCVIQNYEVLKQLDYSKSELITDFSPLRYHCALYLDKVRKLCYRLMEKMSPDEEKSFLQAIKEDLSDCGIPYAEYPYLEMQFAYLFEKSYITDGDLSNIIKHFKALELDNYVDMLQIERRNTGNVTQSSSKEMQSNSQVNTDKSTANIETENITGPSHVRATHSFTNVKTGVYPMDENYPGVVLIIENIHFFEDELDEENKHLVIKTDPGLEEREGSVHDSKRLKVIFERCGFQVIHKTDLKHSQMLSIITEVSHNVITEKHSSFILIMLSHGQLNQIIGCNCIPVEVVDIKKIINSKVLAGKPKILIFQACQGTDILRIESHDITTDAPKAKQSAQYPWQMHLLELWSAVPGVVSFRSKSQGSWMIQTLCDVLESPDREQSFADICTEINRRINHRWVDLEPNKINVMLTNYISTLDKKFILPPLKPAKF